MKRKASIATAAVFLAVLFGFSLLHLALPDREVSRSERRRLAQLPPLSSGFSDKLEEYMLDQFPLREQLRTVNSLVRLYGLGQADIHSIYLQGGGAFRMDGPLQEKQVRHAAAVFSAVQETYFPSLPPHYVIVPDKNAKAETSRPRLDTEALHGIVREALPGMTEIDIWDLLSAERTPTGGRSGCSPSQRPSVKRWARTRREPSRKKRSLRFTARITGRRPCRWPRIR